MRFHNRRISRRWAVLGWIGGLALMTLLLGQTGPCTPGDPLMQSGDILGAFGVDKYGTYQSACISGSEICNRSIGPAKCMLNVFGSGHIQNKSIGPWDLDPAYGGARDVLTVIGDSVQWRPPPTPQIEFAENLTGIVIASGWQSIVSVTIDVPRDGKIHVLGNASMFINSSTRFNTDIGISDTATGQPLSVCSTVIRHADPDGTTTIPASVQYVGDVTAGQHTFHMVGQRSGVSGSIEAIQTQISATYYPD